MSATAVANPGKLTAYDKQVRASLKSAERYRLGRLFMTNAGPHLRRNQPFPKVDYEQDFQKYKDDFVSFYRATDNIYSSSGTGNQYSSQILLELQFLCEQRLGVAYNLTHKFSKTSLFNWFNMKKVDSSPGHGIVNVKGLRKWMRDVDFKNKVIQWNAHKRIYGVGFLVKFWKDREDMSSPPPRSPPKKLEVIPPTVMSPVNAYETRTLSYDEELWWFMGGHLKTAYIHPDRIEVIRGTPTTTTWRGLSVIEPIYLPLICYFNSLVYTTRGIAKWGNMVPVMHGASRSPTPEEYANFMALMELFQANNFYFLGKDDKLEFNNTGIGEGLYKTLEILKEEIASGSGMPLNYLFGRSVSGGIGGEGAITAERTMVNEFANEQTEISDDLWNIFDHARFDVEDLEPDWNIALQKTKEQQLMEDRYSIDNKIAEQQLSMMRKEAKMYDMQMELFEKHKDSFNPEQQMQQAETVKEDFIRMQNRHTKMIEALSRRPNYKLY